MTVRPIGRMMGDMTTTTVTMTTRFVGKCKSCARGYSVEATIETRRKPYKFGGTVSNGSRVTLGAPFSVVYPGVGSWTDNATIAFVQCSCGGARPVQLRKVHGVKSDHVCDARCESATGHVCECSCGGANHGKAHAA